MPADDDENRQQSVAQDIKETWQLLISKRMLILSPVIMWTSLGNAVIPSIFVPMMNDCMT
jgi:hypothetical protein